MNITSEDEALLELFENGQVQHRSGYICILSVKEYR